MRVKKKESLRERFMFLVASMLDAYYTMTEIFINPWDVYGFQAYTRAAKANFESRMKKAGYIEKIVKDGKTYFRLTDKGRQRIIEDIPLLRYQRKPWDRFWRVAIFDIPKERNKIRDKLREKLKELGFGMLQKSVYITPFEITDIINDFLEEQKLDEEVMLLRMERLSGESERELATKVWKLDDLHFQYLDFVQKWSSYFKKKKKFSRKKAEKWRKEYLELLYNDPGLPKELLPEDWLSQEARKIYEKLENFARRHALKQIFKKLKK